MRKGSLGIGLALCTIAVALALAPNAGAFFGWAVRLWPLLIVFAGLASVIGFAARRQPRSPVRGALMLMVGGMALVYTLQSAANPIALFGQFWPLLVGIVAAVEILRHYTHTPAMGDRPPLLTFGKVSLIGLIVVSGLAADRLASVDPNLLSRISMPAKLAKLRDSVFGEVFAFPSVAQSAELPAGTMLILTNSFGDVTIEGGDVENAEIVLSPKVRAYDRATAEQIASKLRLVVEGDGPSLHVGTNRDEIDHNVTTDLRVVVPRGTPMRLQLSRGSLKASGLAIETGGLEIDASRVAISLSDITAATSIKNTYSKVKVENSRGSLEVNGAVDVSVDLFSGDIKLTDSDVVELRNITGRTLELVSVDHGSITIEDARGGDWQPLAVSIDGEHTRVSLARIAGDVRVRMTHDDISANDISGRLDVEASHADLRARRLGSLRVANSRSDIRVDEVGGPIEIVNDHGEVRVREFGASCNIRTSYEDVRVETSRSTVGPIQIENEHGRVDLRLPSGLAYGFEPEVKNGRVRIADELERSVASESVVSVVVRTTYDDIVIRPSES